MADPRAFSPDVVEKVTRLCRLLSDIRIHPFLGPRLVLKGGTALNLFHPGLRRLSVDADLNYVGALDTETTATDRPSILVVEFANSIPIGLMEGIHVGPSFRRSHAPRSKCRL